MLVATGSSGRESRSQELRSTGMFVRRTVAEVTGRVNPEASVCTHPAPRPISCHRRLPATHLADTSPAEVAGTRGSLWDIRSIARCILHGLLTEAMDLVMAGGESGSGTRRAVSPA